MLSPHAPAFGATTGAAPPVFRREMRERWRRSLTFIQLALWVAALAFLGYKFYQALIPPEVVVTLHGTNGAGRALFYAVARAHLLGWIPLGMLLAAPALAIERERGHLPEWTLAGLRPQAIARAKFRALAGLVLVLVCVPFPVLALCFPLGGVAPTEFGAMAALTVSVALLSVAAGLRISARSSRVAEALAGAAGLGVGTLFWGGVMVGVITFTSWRIMLGTALILGWVVYDYARAAAQDFADEIEGEGAVALSNWMAAPLEVASSLAPGSAGASEADGNAGVFRAPDARTTRAWSEARHERPASPIQRTTGCYTPLELWLMSVAARNPVALRDLTMLLRRRDEEWFGERLWAMPVPEIAVFWVGVGAALWATTALFEWQWFVSASVLVLGGAMVQTILASAPGFARERALRTLTGLQLTALSPAEIVSGKIAASLLICVHRYGGPLLGLSVLALRYGPLSALMTLALGAACVWASASVTLWMSLRGRKTEVVNATALASAATLWIILPWLYGNPMTGLDAPAWFARVWLAPLGAWAGASGDLSLGLALGQLALGCAAGAVVFGAGCVARLRRMRAEG